MELATYAVVGFLCASLTMIMVGVPFRARVLELIDQRDAWRDRAMEAEGNMARDQGPEVRLLPAGQHPMTVIAGVEPDDVDDAIEGGYPI